MCVSLTCMPGIDFIDLHQHQCLLQLQRAHMVVVTYLPISRRKFGLPFCLLESCLYLLIVEYQCSVSVGYNYLDKLPE